MKQKWFKESSFLYVPTSAMGWIIVILLVLFCLQVFMAIDRNSHSVSDTLYGIFPFVVPSFLLYIWIGSKTSGKK